ncbi:unnamed protein product [Paramecium sonneborni]|uniref:Uncharacterized protein n=1 Tax=Paramecium sonneborni TaxID=65129 RepID=A0A8S1QZZ8_9CILI|nr:unnamed protein product [Paramecium sonneborni]
MSEGFDYYNQVTYIGEYDQQGLKIGKWDIWFQEACGKKEHKQIGGGSYEYEEGEKKIGMWVEQGNGFWNEAQVIYSGKYDKKGKKVGRWDILYKGEYDLAYQQIGGGLYQKGQLKIKRWIELWDGFWNEAKITYNGEYDLEGIKIGKWKIMYCEKGKKQYQQIGGGSYDSNNLKIGKWAEVFEGFYYRKQVLNIGEYDQKGIKVGIWDIMFQEICGKKGFKQIGGGFYKKGQKIGMWVELDDRFDYYNQVIYKGEYNQKSIKIDRWNIYFKSEYQEEYKQIGGGLYEEGQKVGDWEEISEKFYMKKQIIYKGAYDSKGMKIGIWVVKN